MTKPTHELADAIRNLTARMRRAVDDGGRPRQLDAEDLLEVFLALADELDSPFAELVDPAEACPQCGERCTDRLIWQDDEQVRCAGCGRVFRPWHAEK
jgi:hypothetical protein